MRSKRRQAGFALMVTLMATIVIALLLTAILVTSTEATKFGGKTGNDTRNVAAAQSGTLLARLALQHDVDSVRTFLGTSPGNVVYLVNYSGGTPDSSADTYPDTRFSNTADPFNPGSTVSTGYTTANTKIVDLTSWSNNPLLYSPEVRWVRINVETERSIDQVVVNDSTTATEAMYSTAGVRAPAASAPNGGALIYQIEVYAKRNNQYRTMTEELHGPSISNLLGFNVPATVTFFGNQPVYSDPHSDNWTVSGNDAAPGATTQLPAMGGTSAEAVESLTEDSFRADYSHYPGAEVTSPKPSIVNLAGDGRISTDLNTPAGLKNVYTSLLNSSDVTCGTGLSACPSSAGDGTGFLDSTNPEVTTIQGDYTLPSSGGGILLVTGTVTVPNNVNWSGLLMVVGTGTIKFASNGGGSPNISGAMMVANICANTTSPAADLSNCTTMGNSSLTTFNGGGSGGMTYNSTSISAGLYNSKKAGAFKLISYREQ